MWIDMDINLFAGEKKMGKMKMRFRLMHQHQWRHKLRFLFCRQLAILKPFKGSSLNLASQVNYRLAYFYSIKNTGIFSFSF